MVKNAGGKEDKKFKDIYFPHDEIRKEQDDLILAVKETIEKGKNLIAHAPTGLGKTAATLAPALSLAIKKDLTVFFLTSRHTQHKIAIDTLKQIREKHKLDFTVADIIGKRWMCCVPGIENLYSSEFSEYCKAVREDKKCEFYNKTKQNNKLTVDAKKTIKELQDMGPEHSEKIIEIASEEKLCPYEIATALAAKAKVIVTDYYYIFNQVIRDGFLNKTGKLLENTIIIIDEGHNLPSRIRDLASQRLTSMMIRRAITESKKYKYKQTIAMLAHIQGCLVELSRTLQNRGEKLVRKEDFIRLIEKQYNYDNLISDLNFIGDSIRTAQKQSYVGSVGQFLEGWLGEDKGFTRIIGIYESKVQPIVTLSYRCSDPSIITKQVVDNAHSTIVMSGTLMPTEMYQDLLGFSDDNTELREFQNPFPEDNRLTLIVPKTTTKYNMRSEAQFKAIAKICVDIINRIPGNSAVFFPSYYLRDQIYFYIKEQCKKELIIEKSGLKKSEKFEMMEKFKKGSDTGGVSLLAVAAGSFGEGIDLPGDFIKGVIVVGIPLNRPDLETQELIKYYDMKFRKGWDYGYVMPALTKSLQNAGRCIRTENDKGVIAFIDQRFLWSSYYKCFPTDWNIQVSQDYNKEIDEFFENNVNSKIN